MNIHCFLLNLPYLSGIIAQIMQKRINILSTLLIIVLILGGASKCTTRGARESFKEGYKEGYETGRRLNTPADKDYEAGKKARTVTREDKDIQSLHLHLVPKDYHAYPEKILNTKTGEETPMVLGDVHIGLKDVKNPLRWLAIVLIILEFSAFVFVIVKLVGFLSAVQSSRIFEKENERRLRWMAVMFLIWYAAEWGHSLVHYFFIKSSVALENYSITMERASIYPLVIGITFLLFANIFALGRKMKEDQEFMV